MKKQISTTRTLQTKTTYDPTNKFHYTSFDSTEYNEALLAFYSDRFQYLTIDEIDVNFLPEYINSNYTSMIIIYEDKVTKYIINEGIISESIEVPKDSTYTYEQLEETLNLLQMSPLPSLPSVVFIHGGLQSSPNLLPGGTIFSKYQHTPLTSILHIFHFMNTGSYPKISDNDVVDLKNTIDNDANYENYDVFILAETYVHYFSKNNNNIIEHYSAYNVNSRADILKVIANTSRTSDTHLMCVIYNKDNTKNYLPIIIGIFLIMLAILYFMR